MVRAFGIGIIFGFLFSDITAQHKCSNCRSGYFFTCKWDGTCLWGCTDGYWGYTCHNECNNNMCVQCDNNTGLICSKCVDGYYGSNCEYCCQPGQYVLYNKCHRCGYSGCTCTSHLGCDGCLEGYYANQKYPYLCKECPTNCKQCTNFNSCTSCKKGFYGYKCEHICGSGCKHNQCEIDNGKCTCTSDLFSNDYCSACITGYTYPSKACVCQQGKCATSVNCDKCISDEYFADNGSCCPCSLLKHCKSCSVTLNSSRCIACEEGYYPNEYGDCLNCSVTCLKGQCDSVSGECKEGCTEGYWGTPCNRKCNDFCNTCNRFNGECLECASNLKYGPNCDMNCSETCIDKECIVSGKCTKGCLENYFGNMCEHECDQNCIKSGHGTRCSARSGKCLHGCTSGYTAAVCLTDPQEQGTSSGSRADAVGGAVGGIVMLIIAIITIIAFIVLRKRNGKKETSTFKTNQNDEEHVDSSNVYATANKNRAGQSDVIYANTSDGSTQKVVIFNLFCKNPPEKKCRTKMIEIEDSLEIDDGDAIAREIAIRFEEDGGVYYNNANEVNKTKVKVEEFPAYVSEKTKCSYEEEFKKLPYGLTKSYEDSQKATNMSRNRYKGIYQYDDSRVKVWYNGSDYINASFIDGYKRRNEYIATLVSSLKLRHRTFVNMGHDKSLKKEKCDKYWPDVGSSTRYGNVKVTCLSKDEYADFTRRTFQISMSSEVRKLHQFHFTCWPDKSVPEDVTSLIEFRKMVLYSSNKLNGPTLVHCSAGVGRTGTYIALDILSKEGEAEGSIDVPGCVLNMRRNRPNMIQTLEQYQFLHRALVHSLTLDCNPVTGKCYQQFVDNLSHNDKAKLFKLTQEESQAIERNKNLKGKNRANAAIQVPV